MGMKLARIERGLREVAEIAEERKADPLADASRSRTRKPGAIHI